MNNIENIKILVADDHKLFRSGIMKILNGYDHFSAIAEAENGEELINKYFELMPDVLLVDISMPVLSGIEAIKKIKKTDATVKVLFLSMYDSEEYVYSCLIAGGSGLINKNSMEEELIFAIQKVSNNEKYFGKDYPEDKLKELLNRYKSIHQKSNIADISELTKREIEVLNLIGEGLTSLEIADKLMISVRTVESHRAHLIHKLDIKSLPELIKFAIEYNLKGDD